VRKLATLSLTAALVASGCSTATHQIDHKKAEGLARQIGALKGAVKSASCPTGVKLEKGRNFDCKLVYADGRTGTITIHQLDGKGRIETAGRDLR
jgi:Domain of unknown function (DUF4333)